LIRFFAEKACQAGRPQDFDGLFMLFPVAAFPLRNPSPATLSPQL